VRAFCKKKNPKKRKQKTKKKKRERERERGRKERKKGREKKVLHVRRACLRIRAVPRDVEIVICFEQITERCPVNGEKNGENTRARSLFRGAALAYSAL